jgi:asparagine synthase (glutamine-hydrolysing)
MCGIAGILSLDGRPVVLDELRAMCHALAHRGPDDEGFYVGEGVGLGMRRLSIIDLDAGRQPIANEDGSVRVVFNGEIYNYRALRAELASRGHRLSTATDTETIVHLYEERGRGCVEKLRGMFAFALWDAARRRLILARDRLGIKPLYYTVAGGRLLFASELKAILALGEVEPALSWAGLSHFLAFGTTGREDSMVAGVRKLAPASLVEISPGQMPEPQRYWNVRFEPDRARSEAATAERLRELLEESVRLHMVSDVPVGAFLSGGLDSSTVVALMSRLTPEPIRTFSIGFADPAYDERPYARLVAEAFDTKHHELVLEGDLLDTLADLARCLDEPFGDSSAIPTYMVSKLAAESVKVVLTGDGGDELFAGYDRYAVEGRQRRYRFPLAARALMRAAARRMPEGMRGRNRLHRFSLPAADRYLDALTLFGRAQLGRLLTPEALRRVSRHDAWAMARTPELGRDTHWLSALQYADLQSYLPLDILTKADRMSMAHSLEARVPLLDHELVEFAATIPPELQLRDGTGKHVFRRAVGRLLPEPILRRPKRGFAIPLGHWFRGRLADFARDLLLSSRARARGIFERSGVERLLARPARGHEDLELQLWTLISFELWCGIFVDGGRERARCG